MPIREEAFKTGCGRYIQGDGYIEKCGEEVMRLGSAPLIVGDDTALKITRAALEKSVSVSCKKYEIIAYNGTCNDEAAQKLAAYAQTNGLDVIVGVGGGVMMDFAKLCADFAGVPVLNIPTSSATCAAYASLSVRYTPEGRTVGSKHFKRAVDAVIADTRILSEQPIRLFLAGVFDALAKFLEIKQRFSADLDTEYPIGLDYAYVMSKHSYKLLIAKVEKCISDMQSGVVSFDVENVLFTTIAATGVISGIARGSNQCALAHKFYETARSLFPEASRPHLHGELVGVGLLLQNHFNGEVENNALLLDLMQKHNMPKRVSDVGVEHSKETMEKFYDMICGSSAVDKNNVEECLRFKESLCYLWSL